MTIYTKEHLLKLCEYKTRDELQFVVDKMIQLTEGKMAYDNLVRVITGVTRAKVNQVQISGKKVISTETLRKLSESKIMDFVPFLIQAALSPGKPSQTREIMMLASNLKGGEIYYFETKDGVVKIPHSEKVMVSYILTMAGFERISYYDKEYKTPVKAWKLRHGEKSNDNSLRAEMVYSKIRSLLLLNDMKVTQSKLDELV